MARRSMKPRHRIPGTHSGIRILAIIPPIDDDLDTEIKNALAIRNACTVNGVCPACGATPSRAYRDEYDITHVVFEHEDWCTCLRDDEAA